MSEFEMFIVAYMIAVPIGAVLGIVTANIIIYLYESYQCKMSNYRVKEAIAQGEFTSTVRKKRRAVQDAKESKEYYAWVEQLRQDKRERLLALKRNLMNEAERYKL